MYSIISVRRSLYLHVVLWHCQVIEEESCNSGLFLQYFLLDMFEQYESGAVQPAHFKWAITGGEVIRENTIKVSIFRAFAYAIL